ncbi:hypothetical protein L4D76_28210 [Photobacterium sagamiensis]|uniref:hypothetical protein n=1 Tax=Photobacterium sagamiensis TaxID=2910241 RepID=UPI003D0CE767
MSNEELESSCYEDYEHYKEYRDFLNDGEIKVSEGLDKAVLTISSAALGLTFTFSKSMLDSGELVSIGWLKVSWLFFGLSVFFVLVSLFISGFIYLSNRQMCDSVMTNRVEIIECLRAPPKACPEKIEFTDSKFRGLNQISHFAAPVFLVFGILWLGIFFNLNISESSYGKETNPQPQLNTLSTKETKAENSSTTATTTTQKIPPNDVGVVNVD